MPAPGPCFVIGNWKMNGLAASLATLDAIVAGLGRPEGAVRTAICTPATLVDLAVVRVAGRLAIGGQDCAVAAAGAHTGDVSAEMLRDAGASLAIVGHSERRADHGETDALVRAKAEAARRAGLLAVICVGETRAERDRGEAHAVVGRQLKGSMPEGASAATVVVAYEPVWAIGTGLVASEEDVASMHAFIRAELERDLPAAGSAITILYGGSVKPDNAGALLALPHVGGALVGGASLKAADFLGIVDAAPRG